jgi:hypothetical protein
MGKLAVFMAMKKDLASEYERELRAVRNLILGTTHISGSDYTIDLAATDGFVASSRARAAFVEAFNVAIHDALLKYAQDLARESLDYGMDQHVIGCALAGTTPLQAARIAREQAASVSAEGNALRSIDANTGALVRLAVCG